MVLTCFDRRASEPARSTSEPIDVCARFTPEPFEAEDGIGDEAAFSQTEGLAVLDGDVFSMISANGAVGGDSGSEAMAAMTGAAESKTFVDKDLALAVAEILVGS